MRTTFSVEGVLGPFRDWPQRHCVHQTCRFELLSAPGNGSNPGQTGAVTKCDRRRRLPGPWDYNTPIGDEAKPPPAPESARCSSVSAG